MKQQRWFASHGAELCLVGALCILNSCVGVESPNLAGTCAGSVAKTRSHDVVVRAHRVRGTIARNGRPIGQVNRERGVIDFESHDHRTRAELDLSAGAGDTDNEYALDLPEGTYRVSYRSPMGDHSFGPIVRGVLVDTVEVRGDRSLDLVVNTQATTFSVRLDGASSAAAQVFTVVTPDGTQTTVEQPSGSSQLVVEHLVGAQFELIRPAPISCVAAMNSCDCAYLGAVDTSAASSFSFDLQSVDLRAEFTRDGQRVPASERGDLVFRATGGAHAGLCSFSLDANQPQRRVFAGGYEMTVARAPGVVPSSADVREVTLDGSAPLAVDLNTVQIPVAVTLNGAPIESADPASSVFLLFRGRDGAVLGSAGRGSLPTLRVIPMEASVEAWVLNGECSAQRPCGRAEVRPLGMIEAGTQIQADLRSIEVGLDVTIDDRPATAQQAARISLALRYGESEWEFEPHAQSRADGPIHLLPGAFEPRVSRRRCSVSVDDSVDDPVLCAAGASLGDALDFSASPRQRLAVRHATVRDRLRVVRASSGDELASTLFAVHFLDEHGYAWASAIDPSTRRIHALLPERRFTARADASPCTSGDRSRTACFSTLVFGCE